MEKDIYKYLILDKNSKIVLERHILSLEDIEQGMAIFDLSDNQELIRLQFTGQESLNDEKIFDGAVIKVPDDYDTYGMNAGEEYLVYFGFGGFRCKPKYQKNAKGFYLEDNKEMILLGCSYENPELLEKL